MCVKGGFGFPHTLFLIHIDNVKDVISWFVNLFINPCQIFDIEFEEKVFYWTESGDCAHSADNELIELVDLQDHIFDVEFINVTNCE